ncbi:CDP-alcohol phosphatidyltransferase family protein [Halogranum rubrum]|uniref:CDP-alcohol phosphatidyltransferase family protein n=1 Tax=Halogranum rubrum TaxID=553466 RepID=UPI001FDFD6D2|nr:CDP-alcohol phosphatidyltransferase family protein [Halogranum rubrum]
MTRASTTPQSDRSAQSIRDARRRRRRSALVVVTTVLVATALFTVSLTGLVGTDEAGRWVVFAAAALIAVFGTFAVHRTATAHHSEWPFGVANLVTLARGVLVAWVAGFLLVAWAARGGVVAWLPGLLYGAAAALDAVDGTLARRLGRETALGARLDMAYDAFGLFVAPLVAAAAGQVPWWYLSVGVARYVFVAGIRLRRYRGLAVADLPPRTSRRVLAGLQMAFVAVALTPVVSPAAGRVGAALFGGALLAGFARDWLYVSGRLVERTRPEGESDGDADESLAD